MGDKHSGKRSFSFRQRATVLGDASCRRVEMNLRAALYRAASLLGDVNAIKRGRIVQHVVHKTETRMVSKIVRRIVKGK